jgi:MoaA/NifB/PqqE/SkfB family radical SAM enzyme
MEMKQEPPFLMCIGLVMTYKCQVACPHCVIEAGPHRKEEIGVDEALDWIKQIADYRNGHIKVLALTGGEPFYNIANLKRLASCAKSNRLLVTAVTNAFWATTQEKAEEILRGLPEIKLLAISTDAYHLKSIPFERVRNAVAAAKECNIAYSISVCTENKEDREYQELIKKICKITDVDNIDTVVTFPAGRALKKMGSLNYKMAAAPPISACSSGHSPIIFPDGRMIACIGPVIDLRSHHPLVLGSLRNNSLQKILDKAEMNSVLHAIRIWGPRKLISLIQEAGLDKFLPESYIEDSVCNACYHLMSNDKIVTFLTQLANDLDFERKVAYARAHYLKDFKMLELGEYI